MCLKVSLCAAFDRCNCNNFGVRYKFALLACN